MRALWWPAYRVHPTDSCAWGSNLHWGSAAPAYRQAAELRPADGANDDEREKG